MSKSINITFPFKDSPKGEYLKLSTTNKEAVKSDLLHLIMTNKGERLYLPEFGTNIRKFLMEPNDNITLGNIENEIQESVNKFMPFLNINMVSVINESPNSVYGVRINIGYSVKDDTFTYNDELIISI
jgi:phage baseplate assembly protein W